MTMVLVGLPASHAYCAPWLIWQMRKVMESNLMGSGLLWRRQRPGRKRAFAALVQGNDFHSNDGLTQNRCALEISHVITA